MHRPSLASSLVPSLVVLLSACSGITPPGTGMDGSGSSYEQELGEQGESTGDPEYDGDPVQLSAGGHGGGGESSTGDDEAGCDRIDPIDPDGVDHDGDGVDGTICGLVFVDPLHAHGGSGLVPGEPLSSIAEAVDLAATFDPPRAVLVVAGDYEESVELRSGVDLHGGYAWGFASRDVQTPSVLIGSDRFTMRAQNLYAPLMVQGFTIQGADGEGLGASGYAVGLFDSIGARVTFESSTIVAGDAADGSPGVDGAPGADGEQGSAGEQGGSGGASLCAAPGGIGASAIKCPEAADIEVAEGQGEPGASGLSDCAGTICDDVPEHGEAGGDGALGLHGEAAVQQAVYGKLTDDGKWVMPDGATASAGLPGASGGGGGAASFDIDGFECGAPTLADGGIGGGGGGAGCGGEAGQGGGAGGSSIAIVLVDASIVLRNSRVVRGRGGDGGAGGAGGAGGFGASGGAGLKGSGPDAGDAGDGGAGGRGGGGGGGAGGCGGNSIAIARRGDGIVLQQTTEIVGGEAGVGGAGGFGGGGGIVPPVHTTLSHPGSGGAGCEGAVLDRLAL